MIFEPFAPFLPSEYRIKFATETWERAGAAALRRKVFCEEQGIFAGDDRDAIDDHAILLVAISLWGVAADDVVGTVRIHQAEPGLWWGSRLAVEAGHRRVGALGATLIRLAVSSAHALGAQSFLAHVQNQNALLFQKLHWDVIEPVMLHGHAHFRMQADLAHYPPCFTPEIGFQALPARKAA